MLSSSSPVTAMTRSARWIPARSSTHSSVASPYWTACSSSSSTTRKRPWSDSISVTSWSRPISSRARFHPTFPAPAMITYMRFAPSSSAAQHDLGRLIDRDLRGRHGVQPLLAIPGGAGRIGDAHHHPPDLEASLGNLGDDQVRVVPAGGGDKNVGVLDPGLQQRVDLERRPDGETPARVLPGGRLVLVEPLVRAGVGVAH